MTSKKPAVSVLLLLSIGLYFSCLLFQGYCTDANGDDCEGPGWMMALLGWAGIMNEYGSASLPLLDPNWAWWANPVLFVTWIKIYRKKRNSIWLSFISLLIALSFLLANKIDTGEEGGIRTIITIMPGYWLWIASIMVASLASLMLRDIKRTKV